METLEGKEIPANDYDVMRVIAEGEKAGKRTKITVDIHTE